MAEPDQEPSLIEYPDDAALTAAAEQHEIPAAALIRDVVRTVEVLNLQRKGFFGPRSVLAGSMALRCFGSPRFTIYDADFSTSAEALGDPQRLKNLLTYSDENLDIVAPAPEPHDMRETAFKLEPVTFDPVFTSVALSDGERSFKADVSLRGLIEDGHETPFTVPYGLNLLRSEEIVFVMAPVEILAEKILGWCAHGLSKHYADSAWIAYQANTAKDGPLAFRYPRLREVLHDKLAMMRDLQPRVYADLPDVDALIGQLARPVDRPDDWNSLAYLRGHDADTSWDAARGVVSEILAPELRRSGRR